MVSHLELRDIVSNARKLAEKATKKQEELIAKGKSVSCNIKGTVYSKPYWEGTQEEFVSYILKKYYDSRDFSTDPRGVIKFRDFYSGV